MDEVTPGRRLLIEVVDCLALINAVGENDDLVAAGINSGDLIRLGIVIEERTRKPLSDADLEDLQTVAGIDRVLSARTKLEQRSDVAVPLSSEK